MFDPDYFNRTRALLDALVADHERGEIDDDTYMQRLAVLARNVRLGVPGDTPAVFDTKMRATLYRILGDERKALDCDAAIRLYAQPGFRQNRTMRNKMLRAIHKVVGDDTVARSIYELVAANTEEY